MTFRLHYIGDVSDPIALTDALRLHHDAYRAKTLASIEEHKRHGALGNENTPWPRVVEHLQAALAAAGGEKTPQVREATAAALATLRPELRDPGEHEPTPDLEGITLRFQMPTQARRRELSVKLQQAWSELVKAEGAEVDRAADAVGVCQQAVVAEVLHTLDGVEGLRGSIAESMEGIVMSDLLQPLFSACDWWLELPAGKKLHCGLA